MGGMKVSITQDALQNPNDSPKENPTLLVESLKYLDVFKTLSPNDTHEALQNDPLRALVIQQMKSLDNLVAFSKAMPSEKLRVWLQVMENDLSSFIKQSQDLSALLMGVDLEKCQVICESLQSTLPDMIQSHSDLKVLEEITPTQRDWLYNEVKTRIPYFLDTMKPDLIEYVPANEQEAYTKLPALMDCLIRITGNKTLATAFASSLMSDDSTDINMQLERVLNESPTGITKDSLLSQLDSLWKTKIDVALQAIVPSNAIIEYKKEMGALKEDKPIEPESRNEIN